MVFTMGPGDVVTSFQQWLDGDKLGGAPSLTYTAQTLDYCHERGHAGWLISSCNDARLLESGSLRVENRPKPPTGSGGMSFHWQQWLYCVSLVRSAKAFRATHLVVDSGTTHWFMLFLAAWSGIQVYVSFHNTYYTVGRWRGSVSRNAIRWLDGLFFRWGSSGALGVSQECGKQYVELGGAQDRFFLYNALFRAEDFTRFQPKQHAADRFHLLYVGRVEVDKGALDLLNAVRQVIARHPSRQLQVSYCGSGPAVSLIQAELHADPSLVGRVHLLGHLDRQALLQAYEQCDAVVVPTTSWFMEGFPKVGAEAMLSCRPLIVSDAVPTVEGLRSACVVFKADDANDLAKAIETLWADTGTYERLAHATSQVARKFTDPSKGLCAALGAAIG